MTTDRPVAEVRIGKVKAAVWQNVSERGAHYSVKFTKIYRKEGQWKRTSHFSPYDLTLLRKVLDQIEDKIRELKGGDPEGEEGKRTGNGRNPKISSIHDEKGGAKTESKSLDEQVTQCIEQQAAKAETGKEAA